MIMEKPWRMPMAAQQLAAIMIQSLFRGYSKRK